MIILAYVILNFIFKFNELNISSFILMLLSLEKEIFSLKFINFNKIQILIIMSINKINTINKLILKLKIK